jgi:hypothetical protein
VDGNYDNDYSKIALAVTSAQLAKTTCVKEFGIGEDLSMNFFGWNDDALSIVCQMKQELMRDTPEARLERCAELCNVLRRYWGVDSISMVAEGYCSFDQAETAGTELSQAFLDPNKPVKECITVTHVGPVEKGENVYITTIVAVPYVYELGRSINWFDMIVYPESRKNNFRNARYPAAIDKALKQRVVDDLPDEAYDELRQLILANGFHIEEFD